MTLLTEVAARETDFSNITVFIYSKFYINKKLTITAQNWTQLKWPSMNECTKHTVAFILWNTAQQ